MFVPFACKLRQGVWSGSAVQDMMDFLSVMTIPQLPPAGIDAGGPSAHPCGESEGAASAGTVSFLGAFGLFCFSSVFTSREKSGSGVSGSLRHSGMWSLARLSFSFLLSGWRV